MITNETLKIIKQRRSIRSFLPELISDEKLEAIVTAGQYAPNGSGEAWHFTVIQNNDVIEQLNKLAKQYASSCGLPWLESLGQYEDFHSVYHAPAVILVSGDEQNITSQSDTAAASQNILLAAESLGVGSCWGYFITQAFLTEEGKSMRESLGIPEGYKVYTSVMLGYNAGKATSPRERKANCISFIK